MPLDAFDFRDPRTQPLPDTDAFRAYMSTGWGPLDRSADVAPGAGSAAARHRASLGAELPGRSIVVASGHPVVRANDTEYDFRASSDFVWLTGCTAPGAVLVMRAAGPVHESTLYLPEPVGPGDEAFYADPLRGELWNGPTPSLRDWAAALEVEVRPVGELADALDALDETTRAAGADDPRLEHRFLRSVELEEALSLGKRVKDEWEIEQLRFAVDATVAGFRATAAEIPTSIGFGGERWLQSTFERTARTLGNGVGYSTIVGAGPHAPTLHWVRCDGPVLAGSLVLIDAGVEARTLYTADVTRTFPVDGRFTPAQREVYDRVHAAHLAALAQVGPGRTFEDMRSTAYESIATSLHDMGILRVSVDEAMSPDGQQHRRYLPSGTGHHIGLDVHDCARVNDAAYLRDLLVPGCVLAVEPGMYFHVNDLTVPEELRGFGVRIEDDVLVTATGNEVLSSALPIDAAGVEAWLAEVQGA
ncbi:M24 family metallopeptidase [Pseudoclavibacter chungangensis]|uniref:Xaa-Pro aminopeptidase n=1 Tax=Pseudoclavibacter chungangensis TaxID=587635 RepID=A0A7J5C245_9MICO|nr:aminopeptidase P family protein [Pseudoclavibacter chungangensis]KAB1662533.1 M24 family metallopeptidase [Pseudoclavibacter chungangensis]NYJ68573.1 Xaa-Pro aminopeptidase [Pseudoclavibacter chungangensis]